MNATLYLPLVVLLAGVPGFDVPAQQDRDKVLHAQQTAEIRRRAAEEAEERAAELEALAHRLEALAADAAAAAREARETSRRARKDAQAARRRSNEAGAALRRANQALSATAPGMEVGTAAPSTGATAKDVRPVAPGAPASWMPSWEAPPDLSGLPFSDELPEFPEYRIPTESDCDWIVKGGVMRSQRGLADIPQVNRQDCSLAYRASLDAGHELPITFGVVDSARRVMTRWWDTRDARGVYQGISIEFVGLSDRAEVSPSWGSQNARAEYVGLFNIGLRKLPDSFVIRANDGIGTLIMDGCWWLRDVGTAPFQRTGSSGMHIDKWDTLVWRRHRWRGETPNEVGITLDEHSAYLKSATGAKGGSTWIIENNLFGGLRTGFQIRPGTAGQIVPPRGPVVIAYNYADGVSYDGHAAGYGWNSPGHAGGSCISVWSNPHSSTYIFRNRIQDARYGCLMVGGQSAGIAWNNENGFPIKDVWVFENTFENSTRLQPNPSGGPPKPTTMPRRESSATRGAVYLTSAEHLRIGPNTLEAGASLTLHNDWSFGHGIVRNGVIEIAPSIAAGPITDMDSSGQAYQLSSEVKQAMTVPAWGSGNVPSIEPAQAAPSARLPETPPADELPIGGGS